MRNIEDIISDLLAGSEPDNEQKRRLDEWLESSDGNRRWLELLRAMRNPGVVDSGGRDMEFTRIETAARRKSRRSIVRRFSAAAAVLLIVCTSTLFLRNIPGTDPQVETHTDASLSNHPTLILADGTVVTLSDPTEILPDLYHSNARLEGNTLLYDEELPTDNTGINYNILNIPRGSEFRLRLADGTVVHLNSGSRIEYPVNAVSSAREVRLSGEAYFEVVHDPERPFTVHTDDISVRVLGTSFNVNAYPSFRTVTTTLVSGSVEVNRGEEIYRISPGMQARLNKDNGQMTLDKVNTDYFTSWKEGVLYFQDATLEYIMENLALWYDKEVVYGDDSTRNLRFGGRFDRSSNIAYLLGKFEETENIKFTINERTVTITAN